MDYILLKNDEGCMHVNSKGMHLLLVQYLCPDGQLTILPNDHSLKIALTVPSLLTYQMNYILFGKSNKWLQYKITHWIYIYLHNLVIWTDKLWANVLEYLYPVATHGQVPSDNGSFPTCS